MTPGEISRLKMIAAEELNNPAGTTADERDHARAVVARLVQRAERELRSPGEVYAVRFDTGEGLSTEILFEREEDARQHADVQNDPAGREWSVDPMRVWSSQPLLIPHYFFETKVYHRTGAVGPIKERVHQIWEYNTAHYRDGSLVVTWEEIKQARPGLQRAHTILRRWGYDRAGTLAALRQDAEACRDSLPRD